MSAQQARITGALAGLDALRKLEKAVERFDPDETAEGYFAKRLADSCAFVAALGPMTPEQESAVTALTEYVHMNIGGIMPNLDPGGWVPMSAMTEAERQAMIKRAAADMAEENEEGGDGMSANDQARIAGAKFCIDVLRRAMEDVEAIVRADESVADAFRKKDAVLDEIMTATGVLSPQAAGILGALAELAIDGIQNGYSLCEQLDSDWLPEAAMTAQEVEVARKDFAEEEAAP